MLCTGNFAAKEEELRRQKEMVRRYWLKLQNIHITNLELIDAIQRLGVGYHFEEEIDKSLQYIHDSYFKYSSEDNDIRTVALCFRLLRQQCYPASYDSEGIQLIIDKNVEGVLDLFEAAQFIIAGEEILEKSLEFSSSNLESLLPNMNNSIPTT
ncbi:UNVERIFIED_CONTAM: Germacrene-D synthase [Sesamum indicum]